jgi:HD-like signal output (HDOD) protein
MFKFFKKRSRNPRKELEELLHGYELPSFPANVMKVLNMLQDPDESMAAIAEAIRSDPGMHIMVLKTVNSAAFGLAKKISNIQHATMLLGRSRLETLILPLGVKKSIPQIDFPCINMRSFWLASARRACLADAVAAYLHPTTRNEAFTSGLLQDMAIPVIINCRQNEYCRTLDQWNNDFDARLDHLEQGAIGFDHQSIGALMAQEWNLPEYLVNAILYHHEEKEEVSIEPAIRLVSHIRYENLQGEGTVMEHTRYFLFNNLDLDENAISEMLETAFEHAEEFAALMA